jgi:hypothetical protein
VRRVTTARGCCYTPATASPPRLGPRARVVRVVVGLLWGLGAAALAWPGWWWLWPVAAAAAWLAVSHVVAAATAYPGCPELGAIPSLLTGRPVSTACGPLERLDRVFRATDAPRA